MRRIEPFTHNSTRFKPFEFQAPAPYVTVSERLIEVTLGVTQSQRLVEPLVTEPEPVEPEVAPFELWSIVKYSFELSVDQPERSVTRVIKVTLRLDAPLV